MSEAAVFGVLFLLILLSYIIIYIRVTRKKQETVPKAVYDNMVSEAEKSKRIAVADAEESADKLYYQWKLKEEKKVRADAVKRSKEVIKGKTTEHLIPYMEDFKYNPSDCRFMGSPIDIIVFDGLSEGELTEIIFLEIKAGKHASLSKRERQVRDVIKCREISWRMIKKTD